MIDSENEIIMKKKALVLTYHVKNCTRLGGFHYFINFLTRAGYYVDWVTLTVSSSWIIKNNDKENPKNFFDLWRGFSFKQNEVVVRQFTSPVLIPAKIAKIFHLSLANHYWPQWERLRKRLQNDYDVILVEGVACQYASELRYDYPLAKILYRPSDILSMFSSVPEPEQYEKRMISVSDYTLCVDETSVKYYKGIGADASKLKILRNPITTKEDIDFLNNYIPPENDKLCILYIGVSYIDAEIVQYAASHNPEATFIMVGPLSGKTHDNIIYTGTLEKREYEKFFSKSCIGINPLNNDMIDTNKGIAVGYTRKIINYMKYLMPVVATCSKNYLDVPGFFCVNSKEEFSDKISELLTKDINYRESLRDGYQRVLRVFSEEDSEREFNKYLI